MSECLSAAVMVDPFKVVATYNYILGRGRAQELESPSDKPTSATMRFLPKLLKSLICTDIEAPVSTSAKAARS
jgi:hypothetical protein